MNSKQLQQSIQDLASDDARKRRAAAYRLGRSKDPSVVTYLIEAYNDSDGRVRQNVIDGLRTIGTQDAVEFLNSIGVSTEPSARPGCLKIGAVITLISIVLIGLTILLAFLLMNGWGAVIYKGAELIGSIALLLFIVAALYRVATRGASKYSGK